MSASETGSDEEDADPQGELHSLLEAARDTRHDDLSLLYMQCLAASLVQFACAPLTFLSAHRGYGLVAASIVGLMVLGSAGFQYWVARTLRLWLKRQPCRGTWQHCVDALAGFDGTRGLRCLTSGGPVCMFATVEAIDPALDAWAAANAFSLYAGSLKLEFESSWEGVPLVGWLVAWLGLPGILVVILLGSMLCQLWSLHHRHQYLTSLFDEFADQAQGSAKCRFKVWYEWKHATDLGGLLILLDVFEKLLYAELKRDTQGELYQVVDRFWAFIPKVVAEALPSLWFQVSVLASW